MLFRAKRGLRLEVLPPDFIVYKTVLSGEWAKLPIKGIPAKDAVTTCCESPPLKYYPDYPDTERWWLLCASCHYAISANGLTI